MNEFPLILMPSRHRHSLSHGECLSTEASIDTAVAFNRKKTNYYINNEPKFMKIQKSFPFEIYANGVSEH